MPSSGLQKLEPNRYPPWYLQKRCTGVVGSGRRNPPPSSQPQVLGHLELRRDQSTYPPPPPSEPPYQATCDAHQLRRTDTSRAVIMASGPREPARDR